MCHGCWAEGGLSTDLPENADEIITAIKELYAMERCSVGGPLHVELEDENVEMNWDPYNGRAGEPPLYGDDVMAKARQISDLMTPLSVDQRWAVIGKWRGYF